MFPLQRTHTDTALYWTVYQHHERMSGKFLEVDYFKKPILRLLSRAPVRSHISNNIGQQKAVKVSKLKEKTAGGTFFLVVFFFLLKTFSRIQKCTWCFITPQSSFTLCFLFSFMANVDLTSVLQSNEDPKSLSSSPTMEWK